MAFPQIIWRETNGEEHQLTVVDRVFIGRVCTGAPDDKRVIINDPQVSRDHAVITWHYGQLTVRDTSRNGTRINRERISAGTEYPLKSGDIITVGPLEIEVQMVSAESSAGAAEQDAESTRTLSVQEYVTHLVADMRGFSTFTQANESATVYAMVAELYELLSQVVVAHHGVIKDYAGDAIFAFWEHGTRYRNEAALQACRCAAEQYRALSLRLYATADKQAPLALGWGIATGKVTVAHYGLRPDNLALVGDSTNLAFRLAGLANKNDMPPIVLCEQTAQAARSAFTVLSLGQHATKGRSGEESVFGILPALA